MNLFDSRLISLTPYSPPPYETMREAFSEGAMPEAVYRQLEQKYAALEGVEASHIVYKNDGLRITGILVTPAQMTPGHHPIILYNRGGNREYGKLALHQVVRVFAPLAQAGYLVFASNYRGNDGGEGVEEFGGADVGDVLALLDIATHHPGYDRHNAFMMGHSRGGMMTYLAIKAGANLRAAASIAAPSDLLTSRIERPDTETKVHQQLIAGEGEAREAEYRKRSAVYWPEQLKNVPLLLLHGDTDERVRVSHTQRLSEALSRHGIAHEVTLYPSGNHALVRHWPEVMQRIQEWFTQHRYGAAT